MGKSKCNGMKLVSPRDLVNALAIFLQLFPLAMHLQGNKQCSICYLYNIVHLKGHEFCSLYGFYILSLLRQPGHISWTPHEVKLFDLLITTVLLPFFLL